MRSLLVRPLPTPTTEAACAPDTANVVSLFKAAKLADPVEQEQEVMAFISQMSQPLETDLLHIITPEYVSIGFSHLLLHVGEEVPKACDVVGYVDVPEQLRIIARTAYQLRVECKRILQTRPATYRQYKGEWMFGALAAPDVQWRLKAILFLTESAEKLYGPFFKQHSVVPPNYTKSPSG